jgi:putative phosphoesterase
MKTLELGLISDTHGLLRPEALAALAGCDEILHAGDVGDPEILDQLAAVAPVRAVRGNVDYDGTLARLPAVARLERAGVRLLMLHILGDLGLDPAAAGIGVVIYGHTHEPRSDLRDGVLFVNPGSAGPRRFDLPVTLARLTLGAGAPRVRQVTLVESKK